MKKLSFILLISCFALTSCYSTKKLIGESKNTAIEFSSKNINGIYKNQIGNDEGSGLWSILEDNNSLKINTSKVLENSLVKLELISETRLRTSLIENDSIIKTMEFKGKIVDNYFSINKKFLLIPIPALLFHRERKTIVGNNEEGNLIVTRGYTNGAWFLVMAAEYGGISSFEFELKKN